MEELKKLLLQADDEYLTGLSNRGMVKRGYKDLEQEAERKILIKALNLLSARERSIIQMRFGIGTVDGEEKTQKEVADLLGISQSYISRLEKKIMVRLRKEMVKYS